MWTLYDYLDDKGRDPIAEWVAGLSKPHRARLLAKLAAIQGDRENEREGGAVFPPKIVEGPIKGYPKLRKIKLQGGPSGANERLIVCRGPANTDDEITLLYGARETNKQWDPLNAPELAMKRYDAVQANPNTRRQKREPEKKS